MLLAEKTYTEAEPVAVRLAEVGVIIPTCNAGPRWAELQRMLDVQGVGKHQVLIVDSSSTDNTPRLARAAGYTFLSISRSSFNHGGTRQLASAYFPQSEILLYLTQDAVPAQHNSFEELLRAFDDAKVGAAYGRQLPRTEADPIEVHARLFNYPPRSETRTFESRLQIGIKAAFLSNSFAAYRRSALAEVGGFPSDVILAEDSIVAARLLKAGWKVSYQAAATVMHSHTLTLGQEFRRYFDTGAHHARENWLLDEFGKAGSEGRRFLFSELQFLRTTAVAWVPKAMLRTFSKYLAYQLGQHEQQLPLRLKRRLSTRPDFWQP